MSTDNADDEFVWQSDQVDPHRQRAEDSGHSPLEFRVPVILLVIGFTALLASAFVIGGGAGAFSAGIQLALVLLVELPITIAGMYLLAALLGISYGLLRSAILKLAAITMLGAGSSLAGVASGYPLMGELVIIPLLCYLFGLLFALDIWETLISIVGFCLLGMIVDRLLEWLVGGAIG